MKKFSLILTIISSPLFPASAQILNGGFESWTNDLPDNWYSYDIPGYDLYSQSTDAHGGSYAFTLQVQLVSGQPETTILTTGNGGSYVAHPLSFVPGSVTFWYKMNSVNNDNLALTMIVYDDGFAIGGGYSSFGAAATYTLATAPVLYGSGIPPSADSITLLFSISNAGSTVNAGTQAWIDDVGVSVNSSISENEAPAFEIMPVPADDFLYIKCNDSNPDIMIFDMAGRKVYSKPLAGNEGRISIASYPEGIYHCMVKAADSHAMRSFIVRHR